MGAYHMEEVNVFINENNKITISNGWIGDEYESAVQIDLCQAEMVAKWLLEIKKNEEVF